jgi:hypothetical protein
MRAARWMSMAGLSLSLSGCDLFNPDPGSVAVGGYCRETAQCIDDLVCLDFACVDVAAGRDSGDTTGVPEDTGSPNDGDCLAVGETCSTGAVCCSSICLIGDQICARPCDEDEDCTSGCCVPLVAGGGACGPASACAP